MSAERWVCGRGMPEDRCRWYHRDEYEEFGCGYQTVPEKRWFCERGFSPRRCLDAEHQKDLLCGWNTDLVQIDVDPNASDFDRAKQDALLYGQGYLVDGRRVNPRKVVIVLPPERPDDPDLVESTPVVHERECLKLLGSTRGPCTCRTLEDR